MADREEKKNDSEVKEPVKNPDAAANANVKDQKEGEAGSANDINSEITDGEDA